MVHPTINDVFASGIRTLRIIVFVEAPILRAASITPGSTSVSYTHLPQEESPTDTMMNRSSAAIAIITPAGCRPAKAAAFFAAVWDAPAAALAVAAPPFFTVFAYWRLIFCFCMKREKGLLVSCGFSCKAL